MELTHHKNCIRNLMPENVWDYENGFIWFTNPTRLAKMIAHYELYKMAMLVPGNVIEFGVYKGNSLLQLATYRDMLEMSFSRKIFAFDAFGKFPSDDIKGESDKDFIQAFSFAGGDGLSEIELIWCILIWMFMNQPLLFFR